MQVSDIELISKLYDSTQNGRISWEKTAVEDQYAAVFGGKWTVTIDKGTSPEGVRYWLSINNAEGNEILRITSREDHRISELFDLARRHALKVDEAIADLLKEIDSSF
jgi:hypothetical protein